MNEAEERAFCEDEIEVLGLLVVVVLLFNDAGTTLCPRLERDKLDDSALWCWSLDWAGGAGISCGGDECGEEKVSVAGEPVETNPESSPDDSLIEADRRLDWLLLPL